MHQHSGFDVAVIGAGVFGVWTAYHLRRTGASVVLLDAYGPGNSRASSGGESRIIRMGYGPDEVYTRSAIRSFTLWQEFFDRIEPSNAPLFHQTGVLWLASETDSYCEATLLNLKRFKVRSERLEIAALTATYPQFDFTKTAWGILEPNSGALMARRAVQALAIQTEADGTKLLHETVQPTERQRSLKMISTTKGTQVFADRYVFACGPWLPKLFPEILQGVIQVTRQEIFFFGPPAGDDRFSPGQMPIWIDFNALVYAIPNLENRGFKLAIHEHGPEFDPDTDDRIVTPSGIEKARAYLTQCVPALMNAPLIETRVCQYENTSNGDFLVDQHPDYENVWFVGGGSGHGFKHGPAVAEYVADMIAGHSAPESRFALSTKSKTHHRKVY